MKFDFGIIFVNVAKVYRKFIYSNFKGVRGITKIGQILDNLAINFSLKEIDAGYKYEIDGVEIKMIKKRHFEEIILKDLIQGYTKKRNIQKSDTVVDAGAYPGGFTIFAAKKGKSVVALEPDKKNSNILRENLKLNGLENVEIIEKGLWSEETELSFNSNKEASSIDQDGKNKIQVTKLDNLSNKLQNIDFVKMDIEGAELEVIRSSSEVLKSVKPFFSIAAYHNVGGEKSAKQLKAIFDEKNYNWESGHKPHLTLWAWYDEEG
ncbi:MAG: FkbM family methyltransferase [Candidatus Nanohaloarchaea archaeon]